MKILIFLHGTSIMHRNAFGCSREDRVRQVKDNESSVHDYGSYVPIGNVVNKLKAWKKQGAEIVYLSSHKIKRNVEKDRLVLDKYDFPKGTIYHRKRSENYNQVAEEIMPGILIEDDCESIGGEKEMTFTYIKPELKKKIKLIPVKEFDGIDHLPNKLEELLKFQAN